MVKIYKPRHLREEYKHHFWVTNFSKRDVALYDLRVTIKSNTSVDLLSKGYPFTLEQLKKSAESGSLHAKKKYLNINEKEPEQIKPFQLETVVPDMTLYPGLKVPRSQVRVSIPHYDEFDLPDEAFADEFTETKED